MQLEIIFIKKYYKNSNKIDKINCKKICVMIGFNMYNVMKNRGNIQWKIEKK